ncbi:hypothetical protein L3Q82_018838, partial [Scortum barcoo]
LCSCPEHIVHAKSGSLPSLRASAERADVNRSDAVSTVPVGCYVKAVETDCKEEWLYLWSGKPGVVVPLFKKGDQRVCSNYRGRRHLTVSLVVFCRECSMRVWGPGAFAKGCCSGCTTGAGAWFALLAVSQTCSQCMLDSGRAASLSPVLFIIFMDRISRRIARGHGGSPVWEPQDF